MKKLWKSLLHNKYPPTTNDNTTNINCTNTQHSQKELPRTVSSDLAQLFLRNTFPKVRSARGKPSKATGKVFGTPLSNIPTAATVQVIAGENIACCIPLIVKNCARYLLEEGTNVIGIFRVSGSVRRISELQRLHDTPPLYGTDIELCAGCPYTVHDAANLMRRYLNELPEPVIPNGLYPAFRAAYEKYADDEEAQVGSYMALIRALPISHRHLLLFLTGVLAIFTSHADRTMMTIDNLAALFQPGILNHHCHSLDPGEYMRNQQIVTVLIRHNWALFGQSYYGITRSILSPTLTFPKTSVNSPRTPMLANSRKTLEHKPRRLARGTSLGPKRKPSLVLERKRNSTAVVPIRRSITLTITPIRRSRSSIGTNRKWERKLQETTGSHFPFQFTSCPTDFVIADYTIPNSLPPSNFFPIPPSPTTLFPLPPTRHASITFIVRSPPILQGPPVPWKPYPPKQQKAIAPTNVRPNGGRD